MYTKDLNSFKVAIWNSFLIFAIFLFTISVFEPFAYGNGSLDKAKKVQISGKAQWRFYSGKVNSSSKWKHIDFDDSNWRIDLADLNHFNENIYSRRKFRVKNPASVTRMTLSVACNSPFIAYLNGIEIARSKKSTTEPINLSGFSHELLKGDNILAIELLSYNSGDEDILFIPKLEIEHK